ncbi:DeoR/GlpR family DNA-binding transcription regulator [Aureibacillus halotolerans]|uniref:DeoR family transcriptional regulator n=1 Tax=Aureibacillus halotolerans TaxID=1508390 RepID=A0A4R6TZF8_9BACI|nr:DeoR/GlpR family DNA-binding transcription regulator [Aureibacillus halotolerans]TDQ38272.1 DeoR family transcriptional regulator [Aureibacillus halotolerans]
MLLVAERQQNILEKVNEQGSVRVNELSAFYQVTEETIRRDLFKLEKDGKLKRTHGGAVRITESLETPYLEREVLQAKEKIAISKAAVQWVKEGDSIALDASTTSWYVAQHLPDMRLTVLTNAIQVVTALSGKEQIEVISTGGSLRPSSLSFVGRLAEEALSSYHVNKVFMSCRGLHLPSGIVSEPSEMQCMIKRKMRGIADQAFLLADHSKFGQQSFSALGTLSDYDRIITDWPEDDVPTDILEGVVWQTVRI